MVAPHVETPLTRSLVRIPNSGRDRSAGAVLHDLSRVSSAAAMVPITNYFALGLLSSALSPRRQQQQQQQQNALHQAVNRKLGGNSSNNSSKNLDPPRTANVNATVPQVNARGPFSVVYQRVPTTNTSHGAAVQTDVNHSRSLSGVSQTDSSNSRSSSGANERGTATYSRGIRKRALPTDGSNRGPSTISKVPRYARTTTTQQLQPRTPPLISLSNQYQTRPIEGM